MKTTLFISLLLSLTITGCHFGVQVKDFKPAHSPQGVEIKLKLYRNIIDGDIITGELLEVRDDGLLLNVVKDRNSLKDTRRVVFVPYAIITSDEAVQMGNSKVASKRMKAISATSRKESKKKTDEDTRNMLRLVSRFPQGVSPELMTTLLSAHGQEDVEVLSRD
ncbi:MAG: hypothetical protein JRH15_17450 [Deltaproteobacteria bacterium]|nr:hypothetical protein [Deltaproteobacteria bacterium]